MYEFYGDQWISGFETEKENFHSILCGFLGLDSNV